MTLEPIQRLNKIIEANVILGSDGNVHISGIGLESLSAIEFTITDLKGNTLEKLPMSDVVQNELFSVPSTTKYRNDIIVRVRDAQGLIETLASRHIHLTGAHNFRDFGGYRNLDGQQLPWRRYFRSDNLATLTHDDFRILSDLGISRVFDLRRDQERQESVTTLPFDSKIEIVEVPINSHIIGFEDALGAIFEGKVARITANDMAEMYKDIIANHLNEIQEVVCAILSHDADSVLVHCTAGKDRTGLTVAMVQFALGVSSDDVIYDYLLSNRYRTPIRMAQLRERFRLSGVDIEDFKPYLSAPYIALQAVLDRIQEISSGLRIAG